MAIYETLYPQGNFLNIRANAPTQADYNIRATEDLVRNLPGGLLKDIISPAMAATLSLPYDTIQGISRADSYTPSGIMKSIAAEKPLSSAYERFIGASAPLAERISDMFGMSKAEASDLGEVANLQSYTPNNLPFTSMSDMYNLSQRDLVDQINMGPRSITPPMTMDQMMYGSVLSNNIASPRTVLNQQTGIMQQAPQGIFNDYYGPNIDTSYGVANEEDVEQEFLPDQEPSGIAKLFEFLGKLPTPFNLARRGLGSLRGLNDRIQGSDFGQATSLMDYLDMRKYGGLQGRNDAAARTMAQARGLQKQIDQRPSAIGGGGGGGGQDMGASASRSAKTSQGVTSAQHSAFRN